MPQNTTIHIPGGAWVPLTDADVTAITFQNVGINFVFIQATTDTTAPTTIAGSIRYNPGQGERNVAMSDLFPGVSGGDRLWAYAGQPTDVFVSHA